MISGLFLIVFAGLFMVWDYTQWKAGKGDFFYPMVFGMWAMIIINTIFTLAKG